MGDIKSFKNIGEDVWKNHTVKINSELFTLTYGALVAQICREEKYDFDKVNKQLFDMGYNIGIRLIEEFLCKSNLNRCNNFKETSEAICKIGFKMFLNIIPNITYWSNDGRTFQINLNDNPLSEFVELPDEFDEIDYDEINDDLNNLNFKDNNDEDEINNLLNHKNKNNARKDLWYSNILCGVLKGCLEMVQLDCDVTFISDILRGDPNTEIRVKLLQVLKDEIPDGDEQ